MFELLLLVSVVKSLKLFKFSFLDDLLEAINAEFFLPLIAFSSQTYGLDLHFFCELRFQGFDSLVTGHVGCLLHLLLFVTLALFLDFFVNGHKFLQCAILILELVCV